MKPNKVINNIIGKKQRKKDKDGDGVPDYKDCQPRNVMRQDMSKYSYEQIQRMQTNLDTNKELKMRRGEGVSKI